MRSENVDEARVYTDYARHHGNFDFLLWFNDSSGPTQACDGLGEWKPQAASPVVRFAKAQDKAFVCGVPEDGNGS